MLISQTPYNYNNFTKLNNRKFEHKQMISFTAEPPKLSNDSKIFEPIKKLFRPVMKKYDAGVEFIARRVGNLLDTKFAYNLSQATKRHKKAVFSGLLTLGSVVMSGLYITKTLTNKDLDEKRRTTLAINQTAVFAVSTLMCYTVDNVLNKKIADFANKFEAINAGRDMDKVKLAKCVKGIGTAKTLMIFDMIYRFIAPVLVTPLANHIGNKLQEKQEITSRSRR